MDYWKNKWNSISLVTVLIFILQICICKFKLVKSKFMSDYCKLSKLSSCSKSPSSIIIYKWISKFSQPPPTFIEIALMNINHYQINALQHSLWTSLVLLDRLITSWLANILALWVSVRQWRHSAWEQVLQKNISDEIYWMKNICITRNRNVTANYR